MRKGLVGAVGMIGLVTVAGFSANALAAPKGPTKRAFTQSIIGAQISGNFTSSESVNKVVSSLDGTGGAITDMSNPGTSFPISGTDVATTYFANGVSKTKDKYVLNAPNASGIGTYTGSGKCVGGTGVHKTEKCTYTFTGTYNDKTTLAEAKVTGTDTR